MIDEKFRSRKFLLTASVQAFSSLALALGWLSGGDYTQISMVNVGAYSFANAAVTHSNNKAAT